MPPAVGGHRVAVREGWLVGVLAAVTSAFRLESVPDHRPCRSGVTLVNAGVRSAGGLVLTRDEFPGNGLVDAVIDLPFALPTIVASLVMLALPRAQQPGQTASAAPAGASASACSSSRCRSWSGRCSRSCWSSTRRSGEAATSLGANQPDHLPTSVLPALLPALLTGAGLAFSRAIGEFGSGGPDRRRDPRGDRGVLAVDPHPDRERRPHRCGGDLHCVAGDFVRRVVRPAGGRPPGARREGTRRDPVATGPVRRPLGPGAGPHHVLVWSSRSG